MKRPSGGFVEPFEFTANERERLLEQFGGATRQETRRRRAEPLLDRAQSLITIWLHMREDGATTDATVRDTGQDVAAQVASLLRMLDRLPDSAESHLSAEFQAAIVRDHELASALGEYIPDLYDAWPILERLLKGLQQAGERTAENVQPSTGPSQTSEIALARQLADAYRDTIGREPSKARNGNFRQFLNTLSQILHERGIHASFGDRTIENALS